MSTRGLKKSGRKPQDASQRVCSNPLAERYDLERYVKYAKRFGVGQVFETAKSDLTPRQLVRLAIELRSIDKKWRMDRSDAHSLCCQLYHSTDAETLAAAAGVKVGTVEKWALERIEYVVPINSSVADTKV